VDLAVPQSGSVQVTEIQVIQFTGTYQQGYPPRAAGPHDRVTDVSVSEAIGSPPRQAPRPRQASRRCKSWRSSHRHARDARNPTRSLRTDGPSGCVSDGALLR